MPQIKDISIVKITTNDDDWFCGQEQSGTTFKIKKSDLVQGTPSAGVGYDYRFLGDKNGIIYALGTATHTTTIFTNPASNGVIVATSSSVNNANSAFSKAFGRIPTLAHTSNGSGQWMEVDFVNKSIKPRYYLIQGRNDFNGHHLRNWKLQGSNNRLTWTDLDTQSANTTINQSTWFVGDCRGVAQFYRYVRILQTGSNSSGDTFLTLGQIEFYGDML